MPGNHGWFIEHVCPIVSAEVEKEVLNMSHHSAHVYQMPSFFPFIKVFQGKFFICHISGGYIIKQLAESTEVENHFAEAEQKLKRLETAKKPEKVERKTSVTRTGYRQSLEFRLGSTHGRQTACLTIFERVVEA
jgi:hypothetical protein